MAERETQVLEISKIEKRPECQPRVEFDTDTMIEYAEAMQAGDAFPPVQVVSDGELYWLYDGFHRIEAAESAGLTTIKAEVTEGTLRDAILLSRQVNATHGLRRTNEDKRRAVMTLLDDPEWGQWSDREIARRCKVSNTFVSKLRSENTVNDDSVRTYTDRFGNVTEMDTSNIGKTSEEPDEAQAIRDLLAFESEALLISRIGEASTTALRRALEAETYGHHREWMLDALKGEIQRRVAEWSKKDAETLRATRRLYARIRGERDEGPPEPGDAGDVDLGEAIMQYLREQNGPISGKPARSRAQIGVYLHAVEALRADVDKTTQTLIKTLPGSFTRNGLEAALAGVEHGLRRRLHAVGGDGAPAAKAAESEREPNAWAPPLKPKTEVSTDVYHTPRHDEPDYDPREAARRILNLNERIAHTISAHGTARMVMEVAGELARYVLAQDEGESAEPVPEPGEARVDDVVAVVAPSVEPEPEPEPEPPPPPPFDIGAYVCWGEGTCGQVVNWSVSGRVAFIKQAGGQQVSMPAFMLKEVEATDAVA